jgi:predicted transcriptional regulator
MTEKQKKKAMQLYKQGRKLREIAEEVGVTYATIKSHVAAHRENYGRRNLRYTAEQFRWIERKIAEGETRKAIADGACLKENQVLSLTISAANAARMSRKEWMEAARNHKQIKYFGYEE